MIQGGGTKPDGSDNDPVSTLQSEAGISNTTGTIAMALNSNGPGSATNQWFINLADNTDLDGTADGGPFTAFGNVIDGTMSVANAIANLPIIDGSAENPQWYFGPGDGLPVVNYTGGASPSSVPQDNLVTDTVSVVPADQAAATFSVVSNDPSLVTASVTNGMLTLTPASATASGSATVTATITDIGGETASSTFNVNVARPDQSGFSSRPRQCESRQNDGDADQSGRYRRFGKSDCRREGEAHHRQRPQRRDRRRDLPGRVQIQRRGQLQRSHFHKSRQLHLGSGGWIGGLSAIGEFQGACRRRDATSLYAAAHANGRWRCHHAGDCRGRGSHSATSSPPMIPT